MKCTFRKNKSHTIWLASLWVVMFSTSDQAMAESAESQTETQLQQTILMVVSGYGEDQGKTKPGFEFDELAKAYLTFRDNGVAIDIASPQGGAVEADEYDANKSYNQTFLADQQAVSKLTDTLALNAINSSDYAAVFVVGGKGAMFDLPYDKTLQHIIADVYQAGGSVGAVCHGPAALVDVKLDNGSYLVTGKKVNSFTNIEEQVFGKKWVQHFDFLIEDKFKERQAHFESSPMMLSHVAIDQRLVTGQNPASTVDTAQTLLKAMGITPNSGNQYSDDLTLKLVAEILKGDEQAIHEYQNNTASYQPMLMGMYGYMYFAAAEAEDDYRKAMTLMQLAQDDMNHPKLNLQIAKAHMKLDQTSQAKKLLTELSTSHPDLTEAQDLLAQLQ
ncbi:DJ-1/PfpI family protein [Marinicella sp. S1101]|uniref:DJ-1/PfpI family protein n=1 Tax=Marinicella marina TaxID=2996016 RepID=UPI002260C18B|nr:DJ-1/PfpI family protein [Marinicella marina]MCX7554859.1 DJ-1/PfpI family protein [Marinicella marina]MDJ1141517.1 DJ-1/PfpI family protein [Marinicella marina]